ncbi:TlpA family protein disulfide reductase [Bacteroidota bacterium]
MKNLRINLIYCLILICGVFLLINCSNQTETNWILAKLQSDSVNASTGFRPASAYETDGEIFPDEFVDDLLYLLEEHIKDSTVQADFVKESGLHFWRFFNRLSQGVLSPEQTTLVKDYFNELKVLYPNASDNIDKRLFQLNNLMPGKEAPNIVGEDIKGVPFELKDYRGKITVLVFSGQWCGPCRSEYPYQRFLLELFKDDPVDIVSVNSDPMEVAKVYKKENNLNYRSFFDGGGTKGPIATRWNVSGWPQTYILDENGIIRTVGARHEMMITVVKELLYKMK